MRILRIGSRGLDVQYLQGLVNKADLRDVVIGTRLATDGDFGPLTDAAVRAFQRRRAGLRVDGIVGHMTWNALGHRVERLHSSVILFGQPTNTSCWSAAATMIQGNQSVGPGGARLGAGGGLAGTVDNREEFARSLGWTMLNYSPSVSDLVGIVQQKPVWIAGGGSNWSHAVVLSGVYSDLDDAGDGTLFRVHDPWPPNHGKIYGSFANPLTMYNSSGTARVPASLSGVLVPR